MRYIACLLCLALLAGCQTTNHRGTNSAPAASVMAQATFPQGKGAPLGPYSLPPQLSYAGGDGSSVENAIRIVGAADEDVGVRSEYIWLAQHYPGYQRRSQALLQDGNGHYYDLLEVTLANGEKCSFYFDITEFFGKY
jgi:hypothetical protein